MKKNINNKRGFTLIEALLVISIILIIASLIIRIVYGSQLIEWEDNFYRSIGLNPSLVHFFIGIIVVVYFVRRAFSERRKKKH